jgi:hypothetical protein
MSWRHTVAQATALRRRSCGVQDLRISAAIARTFAGAGTVSKTSAFEGALNPRVCFELATMGVSLLSPLTGLSGAFQFTR